MEDLLYQSIKVSIRSLTNEYKNKLKININKRIAEMENDDNEHYLIYNLLGITRKEGFDIDLHENVARFLYKYSGTFLEQATIKCIEWTNKDTKSKFMVNNIFGGSPKKFEIDILVGNRAYEIKWKDATTDGDHIRKERNRVAAIKQCGYKPIRLMFYEPNRDKAKAIQKRIHDLYDEIGGEYYSGEKAWEHLFDITGIDLKKMIIEIINEEIR